MSVESLLFLPVAALQFSSMDHEISSVKRARLLSQNQIREIVMDSDSNEEKYYASENMEDDEPRPPSFLALTLQMGHTVQGRLEDYWTKMEQLCTPLYGQTMARARYYHYAFYISQTIIGMELTEQMTDCGKYETCLKL